MEQCEHKSDVHIVQLSHTTQQRLLILIILKKIYINIVELVQGKTHRYPYLILGQAYRYDHRVTLVHIYTRPACESYVLLTALEIKLCQHPYYLLFLYFSK